MSVTDLSETSLDVVFKQFAQFICDGRYGRLGNVLFYLIFLVYTVSWVVLKRTGVLRCCLAAGSLFGGGVLGDSLGTFRDGVLGQLTGQEQTDGGLDLATADG